MTLLDVCLFVWGCCVLLSLILIVRILFLKNNETCKFNLTKEDIDFLIELQHEMLTQDHVGQSAPRFWVVEGTKRVFCGEEYGTDGEVLYQDVDECADGIDDAVTYFLDNYDMTLAEKEIVTITKDEFCNEYIVKHVVQHENDEEVLELESVTTISELIDTLESMEVIPENVYESGYYRLEPCIYPNTMFLTNRSCKKHIEANHYHYSSDAHSYAMTAWRSPEVERLFNILDKINWHLMKEEAYGVETEQ